MTRDDVDFLARKAGFTDCNRHSPFIVRHSNGSWVDVAPEVEALVHLAYAAGAAAEREACAKACENMPWVNGKTLPSNVEMAAAIRARSNHA